MRLLKSHLVEGDPRVLVGATDEPNPGCACHEYLITHPFRGSEPGEEEVLGRIKFQEGPIHEKGVNGVTHEQLLAIVIDRLRSFQQGPYRCRENALALTNLEQSLQWLQQRTRDRRASVVEPL